MAERIEGGGAGAAAGYAKFCRPCVVATVDSLQAPRAGEKGRGRVIPMPGRGSGRREATTGPEGPYFYGGVPYERLY